MGSPPSGRPLRRAGTRPVCAAGTSCLRRGDLLSAPRAPVLSAPRAPVLSAPRAPSGRPVEHGSNGITDAPADGQLRGTSTRPVWAARNRQAPRSGTGADGIVDPQRVGRYSERAPVPVCAARTRRAPRRNGTGGSPVGANGRALRAGTRPVRAARTRRAPGREWNWRIADAQRAGTAESGHASGLGRAPGGRPGFQNSGVPASGRRAPTRLPLRLRGGVRRRTGVRAVRSPGTCTRPRPSGAPGRAGGQRAGGRRRAVAASHLRLPAEAGESPPKRARRAATRRCGGVDAR